MNIVTSVLGLLLVAGLVGCASFNRCIVQSLTHMAGGITQQDMSEESFQRHISPTNGKCILIIRCCVTDVAKPKVLQQTHDTFHPAASILTASELLSTAITQIRHELGWQPTMALLVLTSGRAYAWTNDIGIPIYVVSSDKMDGGMELEESISTNLSALARRTLGSFPYETNHVHISDMDKIINYGIDLDAGYGHVAKSQEEVHELNKCRRANYQRALTTSWPALLPDADAATDILYIAWNGRRGTVTTTGDKPVWGGAYAIALISRKDSQIYYFHHEFIHQGYNNASPDGVNLGLPATFVVNDLKEVAELRRRPPLPKP